MNFGKQKVTIHQPPKFEVNDAKISPVKSVPEKSTDETKSGKHSRKIVIDTDELQRIVAL